MAFLPPFPILKLEGGEEGSGPGSNRAFCNTRRGDFASSKIEPKLNLQKVPMELEEVPAFFKIRGVEHGYAADLWASLLCPPFFEGEKKMAALRHDPESCQQWLWEQIASLRNTTAFLIASSPARWRKSTGSSFRRLCQGC